MTARASLLALAALFGLAACSSAPTRYYTLIAAQPQASAAAAEPAAFQFEVLPIRIPVQVDQPGLVVRESAGNLAILETARWASPPADELHDALTIELEHRLGVRDLAGLPKEHDRPLLRLRADVRRFDSVPGRYASLDVLWNLSLGEAGKQQRSLTCASVLREPAGVGLDSLVLAHQRAIGALADSIAATARQWARHPGTACP
jgi:uncharacterized lipoprotein YmbA